MITTSGTYSNHVENLAPVPLSWQGWEFIFILHQEVFNYVFHGNKQALIRFGILHHKLKPIVIFSYEGND